jgi:hypothetical protein
MEEMAMKKKVRISLNPLESGHAFREDVMEKVNEILEESLNPLESGHAFRERGSGVQE